MPFRWCLRVLLLVAFVTAASAFTTPFLRGFGSQSLGPAAPFSRPAVGLAKLRAEVDGQSMDAESELERLKQRAAAALKAAEEAEKRAEELKRSPANELAAVAKKFAEQKKRKELEREAEKRAEEAALFATQADQAERQRGTTTLAQKFSDKSRDAILRADEAQLRADAIGRPSIEDSTGTEARAGGAPSFQEAVDALRGVQLIPEAGTRTAIQKTTGALDDLKQLRRLVAWDSLDASLGARGFRGASSLEQLLRASGVQDGEVDRFLGVNGFKALSVKNGFSATLMLLGGLGLIYASFLGGSGALPKDQAAASALTTAGYGALVINVALGLFSQQSNDWLATQLHRLDYDRYAERALVCEAAHLLVAWLCGTPLQEYRREHAGYPVRERPTGRAQIYSSRRGDPEVAPRMRPFGLPPWASLERPVVGDGLLDSLNAEPVRNGYTQKEIDHLSLILLAGPVAEFLYFGESTNGAPCYQQLDTCMLMAQTSMSGEAMQGQARWALIKLLELLKQNKGRLTAAVDAIRREATLLEVLAAIEAAPDGP